MTRNEDTKDCTHPDCSCRTARLCQAKNGPSASAVAFFNLSRFVKDFINKAELIKKERNGK